MPRKTKEIDAKEDTEIKEKKDSTNLKSSSKKEKKTSSKISENKPKKVSASKQEKDKNKIDTKTTAKNKSRTVKKEVVEKKSNTKKTSKSSTTTKRSTKKAETNPIIEYYDLPYKYNLTVIKLLAQTPNSLFVYWEISDLDRENYIKKYGEDFFYTTKPILKIFNDTLNYSFEIDINDFANCWYIRVNDANSIYRAELARRPINYNSNIQENYIYVTSSNKMDSPNDHILFEKITPNFNFKFKNVKNNQISYKNITNIISGQNIIPTKSLYNISQLYSLIYETQNIEELYRLSNPSSNFSSRN